MELDLDVYQKMRAVNWFSQCGLEPSNELPFQFQRATDVDAAIASACASGWRDAGTAAQGELTRYLAKTDYGVYGTNWNRLARDSRERMEKEVMPGVREALAGIAAEVLSDVVLLDLNRIAIRSAFSKQFRRIPDFYQGLLVVYENGHLPCGWIGNLDLWPNGELVVY